MLAYTFLSMPEFKETLIKPESLNTKVETDVRNTGLVDVEARTKVPENIKTWLQKIEEAPATTTVNDQNGVPVLQPSSPQQPIVRLPTTKPKFLAGFKKTVNEAGKWLSVFVLRLIKIKKGKVNFLDD